MKNLLIIPTLVLAACVSTPGSVPVADGPVARTIERVLERTETYMASETPPVPIGEEMRDKVAAAIEVARVMVLLPEASGDMLLVTMGSIMSLHDYMVRNDSELDPLERDIYLESTARLRSLFESVAIHEPELAPTQ